MRRITMLALVAVLALTGAACGDDDDSGSGDEDTSADDGGSTDDGGDDGSATDGDIAAGLVDEDCQFLLAGSFLNPLGSVASGQADDLEDVSSQLEAIADEAPDEISDAMQTLAEGYSAMIEAFGDIDLSNPASFTDPEVQDRLDELEDVFDEEYQEAGEEVNAYIQENCTGAAAN